MREMKDGLGTALDGLLGNRVCIAGVGNRQRGDDGAGPRVIDARYPGARGVWLDTGTAPENYLEPMVRTDPDTVLIVDAVAFAGFPGECRLFDVASLDMTVLTTHAGSLTLLGGYLAARTGASIHVVAIQPQTIDAGEGLSLPVGEAVDRLARVLSDLTAARGGDFRQHSMPGASTRS